LQINVLNIYGLVVVVVVLVVVNYYERKTA